MTESRSAQELFQAAYENRYTWEKTFPGYTATVQLKQGDETFEGTVKVNPNLSAEVIGVDNEDARNAIIGQLREVAIHRVRRTFAETHGKNSFSYGATDETGAVEILMGGKSEVIPLMLRKTTTGMVSNQRNKRNKIQKPPTPRLFNNTPYGEVNDCSETT